MGFAPLEPHKGGLRPPLTLPKGSAEPEMPRLVFDLDANAFMYRSRHTSLSWSNQIRVSGYRRTTTNRRLTQVSQAVHERSEAERLGESKGGKPFAGIQRGRAPLEKRTCVLLRTVL